MLLTLLLAESLALQHSPLLKQAESNLEASLSQVEIQLSQMIPRVTLDGNLQYQSEVPQFSATPTAPKVPFGDHKSYSIGPTLTYTLFDNGGLLKSWKSQKALAQSAEAQRDLLRRQVKLMTRLDYFQVQLALEQVRSLADSLKLSRIQYDDITKRFHAGTSSRVDWLSAHQQLLDRRRDLRSAQAEFAAALRALYARLGQEQDVDVSTSAVQLDPLEDVARRLAPAGQAALDQVYPQLLVYARQAEAQELAADGAAASRWPKFFLSYKSAYQYPNMPLLERVWQNTAGVSASMPLFDYGRVKNQEKAARALSQAAYHQRQEAYDSLKRDFSRARDQLSALRDEQGLDAESVDETAEIAKLRYTSYKDGGSTILDVETANVNSVHARVTAARTLTQILIQLATLDSFSAGKDTP